MSPQKQIKKEALGRLKGSWPTALGILCVPLTVWVALAFAAEYVYYCAGLFSTRNEAQLLGSPWLLQVFVLVSLGQVLVGLLVLRPLMLGVRRWWCALAFGNNIGAGACLYYFSRTEYGRCVRYSLRLLGKILLRALPVITGVLAFTALCGTIANPAILPELFRNGFGALARRELALLSDCFVFGMVLGAFALIGLCMPFFLSDYLYITERELNCIAHSAAIMRTQLTRGWKALLSFVWWALLSIFAFPLLFTVPYAGVSMAVTRKWLVYNYRNPQPVSSEPVASVVNGAQ